jgi:hypothetical protein
VDIPVSTAAASYPPLNCPVCPIVAQFDLDSHPQDVQNGYAYRGHEYHVYDFIHYVAVDGPCKTGQIISFESSGRRSIPHAVINLLGCMDQIKNNRPRDYIKDEVFLCSSVHFIVLLILS